MEHIPRPLLNALPTFCEAIKTLLDSIKESFEEELHIRRHENEQNREEILDAERRQPRQLAETQYGKRCTDTPGHDHCLFCNEPPVYLGRCKNHEPEGGKHYCTSCYRLTTEHRDQHRRKRPYIPANNCQASRAGFESALARLHLS